MRFRDLLHIAIGGIICGLVVLAAEALDRRYALARAAWLSLWARVR